MRREDQKGRDREERRREREEEEGRVDNCHCRRWPCSYSRLTKFQRNARRESKKGGDRPDQEHSRRLFRNTADATKARLPWKSRDTWGGGGDKRSVTYTSCIRIIAQHVEVLALKQGTQFDEHY